MLQLLLCNTLSNKVVVDRLGLSEESKRIQKLQAALETGKFQAFLEFLLVSKLRKRGRQERNVAALPAIR